MKAKTAETSCFHKKYTSIIYDNDGGRLVYINPTNTTKRMANVNTRQFNYALSAHVVKETEQLQTEIDRLKKEVERLKGDKWISVDEKPKEGKPVLICIENEYKKRFVLRATWIPKYSMTTDDADYEGDADYNEENDHYYWPEGWYEWNRYEEIHFCVDDTVIAWQPLPQPK